MFKKLKTETGRADFCVIFLAVLCAPWVAKGCGCI